MIQIESLGVEEDFAGLHMTFDQDLRYALLDAQVGQSCHFTAEAETIKTAP